MTENPYETPAANLDDRTSGTPIAVYTPVQVAMGTFWGGPFATVYFLRANYLSLGKPDLAYRTIVLGIIFVTAIIATFPFVPEGWPDFFLPLVYCLAAKEIASRTQVTKEQIEASNIYTRISSWRVFGIGCITLVLFLIIIVLAVLAFESLGLLSFDP